MADELKTGANVSIYVPPTVQELLDKAAAEGTLPTWPPSPYTIVYPSAPANWYISWDDIYSAVTANYPCDLSGAPDCTNKWSVSIEHTDGFFANIPPVGAGEGDNRPHYADNQISLDDLYDGNWNAFDVTSGPETYQYDVNQPYYGLPDMLGAINAQLQEWTYFEQSQARCMGIADGAEWLEIGLALDTGEVLSEEEFYSRYGLGAISGAEVTQNVYGPFPSGYGGEGIRIGVDNWSRPRAVTMRKVYIEKFNIIITTIWTRFLSDEVTGSEIYLDGTNDAGSTGAVGEGVGTGYITPTGTYVSDPAVAGGSWMGQRIRTGGYYAPVTVNDWRLVTNASGGTDLVLVGSNGGTTTIPQTTAGTTAKKYRVKITQSYRSQVSKFYEWWHTSEFTAKITRIDAINIQNGAVLASMSTYVPIAYTTQTSEVHAIYDWAYSTYWGAMTFRDAGENSPYDSWYDQTIKSFVDKTTQVYNQLVSSRDNWLTSYNQQRYQWFSTNAQMQRDWFTNARVDYYRSLWEIMYPGKTWPLSVDSLFSKPLAPEVVPLVNFGFQSAVNWLLSLRAMYPEETVEASAEAQAGSNTTVTNQTVEEPSVNVTLTTRVGDSSSSSQFSGQSIGLQSTVSIQLDPQQVLEDNAVKPPDVEPFVPSQRDPDLNWDLPDYSQTTCPYGRL